MKITLAKTAGFCFGVNRAVDMVEKLAESGEKVCTLGPIIHNENVVRELEDNGVYSIDSLDGDSSIIGVPGYGSIHNASWE